MKNEGEMVYYGGISLVRGYCLKCRGHAFVKGGYLACCNSPVPQGFEIIRKVRENTPRDNSTRTYLSIPKKKRLALLNKQNWSCIYCCLPFMACEVIDQETKTVRMPRITWDHFIPWIFAQSHKVDLFAACQICNGIKNSKLFASLLEARNHIEDRWKERYSLWRILDSAPVGCAVNPFKPPAGNKFFATSDVDTTGTTNAPAQLKNS